MWCHTVGQMTRCLVGSQVAAHGEHGEQVALACVAKFGIVARLRSKVPGESSPVLDVGENIQQVARGCAIFDSGMQCDGRGRNFARGNTPQRRLTVGTDHHVSGMLGKLIVDFLAVSVSNCLSPSTKSPAVAGIPIRSQ